MAQNEAMRTGFLNFWNEYPDGEILMYETASMENISSVQIAEILNAMKDNEKTVIGASVLSVDVKDTFPKVHGDKLKVLEKGLSVFLSKKEI